MPSEGDKRTVKRACWQCKSHEQAWSKGAWFCVNMCGPKSLADLFKF